MLFVFHPPFFFFLIRSLFFIPFFFFLIQSLFFIPFFALFLLSDMLFAIGGGFGIWFVLVPLCDPLWVLLFWLRLGSSFYVPSFLNPVAGCFVWWSFARVSSPMIILLLFQLHLLTIIYSLGFTWVTNL
jgi:hypothetical protein